MELTAMNCEIITIGDELTSGKIPDLNSWYACGRLIAAGLRVSRSTSVGDDHATASREIKDAMVRGGWIVVTGGLGSTDDDMTCKIASEALNRPLARHPDFYRNIMSHAGGRGRPVNRQMEKMAMLPEGAEPLDPAEAVCGFRIDAGSAVFFFLPGVPDQMRRLLDSRVIPEIVSSSGPLPVIRQSVIKLYGLGESRIAEILDGLQKSEKSVVFGFYPRHPENHVTFSLTGENEPEVLKDLKRVQRAACDLLGNFVFAVGDRTMGQVVGEMLRLRGQTVALAESCTGGLVGHLLTNEPGSSHYFKGGCTAYSNEAKVNLLKVKKTTLESHGAVSTFTAGEMAKGARELFRADIGVSITGVAGPGGGSESKPVGTVCLGLASENELSTGKYLFRGTRVNVKEEAAAMALDWIRRYLNGDSFLPGI